MSKSPDAFKTISEVADELKLPQHVLRFWETRFSQIKPMKRGGGRRYYRPDDVSLLRGIRHLLYGEGYTIKGVQRILKDQGARYVATIWQDVDQSEASEKISAPQPVAVDAPEVIPARNESSEQTPSSTVDANTPAQQNGGNGAVVAPIQSANGVAPAQSAVVQQASVSTQTAQDSIVREPTSNVPVERAPTTSSSKQQVMPPFVVTHGVPAHLVEAITPETTLVEPVPFAEEVSGEQGQTIPADILDDDSNDTGLAKSLGRGLLGKITGSDDGMGKKQNNALLPKDDVDRLQATLVDLLECKRLLDQIR